MKFEDKPTIKLTNHRGETVEIGLDSDGDLAFEWWSEIDARYLYLRDGLDKLKAYLNRYVEDPE